MAMAWITKITNETQSDFSMYQNDRSWHPVIEGRTFGPDARIGVAAGARLTAKYLVIPWYDFPAHPGVGAYARVGLVGPKGAVEFYVSPGPDGQDYIHIRDSNRNEIGSTKLGPRGGAPFGGSGDFHLIIKDDGVHFELLAHSDPFPLSDVLKFFAEIAATLIGLLV